MRIEQIVWGCAAVLLMAAEMVVPGAFLLWLGFAAAGVFVVVMAFPDLALIWQAVIFLALALASVAFYRSVLRKTNVASDQPLLNRRAEQLVGQVYPLDAAIVDGRGRLKIGDAFWSVEGVDAPVGTKVRIVAVRDMTLQVRADG